MSRKCFLVSGENFYPSPRRQEFRENLMIFKHFRYLLRNQDLKCILVEHQTNCYVHSIALFFAFLTTRPESLFYRPQIRSRFLDRNHVAITAHCWAFNARFTPQKSIISQKQIW
jgi:hypothetical protein